MKKMLREFKDFAMRGNVVDMAVGVVVGGAFSKIVTSLVNDVIMPLIGALLGNTSFSDLAIELVPAAGETPAVLLKYGSLIQTIVDFIIIAFCIFIVVKAINTMNAKMHKKKEEAAEEAKAAEPVIGKEEALLMEIRDLLKNK